MPEYLPVPGYPDYLVGDDGTILSRKIRGSRNGRLGPWKPLKQKRFKSVSQKKTYCCVNLYIEKNKPDRKLVHQLVLLAFVGPTPENQEVRHLDGNGENNNLSNLAYGTKRQNFEDGLRLGEVSLGENHYKAKLTNDQIREIRQLAEEGKHHRLIGEMFGVSQHYVAKIACREIWKYV